MGVDVHVIIKNDFVDIGDKADHHQQLTLHNGKEFHIRKMAYELAKLFDQREAWYCMDKDSEETDLEFNQWLQFMTGKYGEKSGGYIEPKPFYHDTFLECKIDDELKSDGFSIEDLTSGEFERLIHEIKLMDEGCMILDGVLAFKDRY